MLILLLKILLNKLKRMLISFYDVKIRHPLSTIVGFCTLFMNEARQYVNNFLTAREQFFKNLLKDPLNYMFSPEFAFWFAFFLGLYLL